jgi:hypothetical protein
MLLISKTFLCRPYATSSDSYHTPKQSLIKVNALWKTIYVAVLPTAVNICRTPTAIKRTKGSHKTATPALPHGHLRIISATAVNSRQQRP